MFLSNSQHSVQSHNVTMQRLATLSRRIHKRTANRANVAHLGWMDALWYVSCSLSAQGRCSNPMGVDYQEIMCNQISGANTHTRHTHTHTHKEMGGRKTHVCWLEWPDSHVHTQEPWLFFLTFGRRLKWRSSFSVGLTRQWGGERLKQTAECCTVLYHSTTCFLLSSEEHLLCKAAENLSCNW